MDEAAPLRQEAARFREMARAADDETARSLLVLAEDYEGMAEDLENRPIPPMPEAA